jgi:hypothetical protein
MFSLLLSSFPLLDASYLAPQTLAWATFWSRPSALAYRTRKKKTTRSSQQERKLSGFTNEQKHKKNTIQRAAQNGQQMVTCH